MMSDLDIIHTLTMNQIAMNKITICFEMPHGEEHIVTTKMFYYKDWCVVVHDDVTQMVYYIFYENIKWITPRF